MADLRNIFKVTILKLTGIKLKEHLRDTTALFNFIFHLIYPRYMETAYGCTYNLN